MPFFLLRSCCVFLALTVGCFILLPLSAAQARQVEVTWQMQADETLEQGKKRAMEMGWTQAAFQEALQLLPGELAEERKELLRQYLAPRAQRLIESSEELRLSERVDGMLLDLEVEVNIPALRQLLQRMGVFFTVGQRLPYSLSLAEAPEGAAGTISRLETLTGLYQEEGASPRLQLTHDGTNWQGAIEAGQGRYDVAGSDLETLWFSLWGWYFTVHGPEAAPSGGQAAGPATTVELVVEGWTSPDGVYSFEQVLTGFRPLLAEATLTSLNMRSSGVAGVWEVAVHDVEAFRRRLGAYLQGRNLTWTLDGVPGAAPQEQPASQASKAGSTPQQAPELTTRPWQQTPSLQPEVQQESRPAAQPEEAPAVSPQQTPPQQSQGVGHEG